MTSRPSDDPSLTGPRKRPKFNHVAAPFPKPAFDTPAVKPTPGRATPRFAAFPTSTFTGTSSESEPSKLTLRLAQDGRVHTQTVKTPMKVLQPPKLASTSPSTPSKPFGPVVMPTIPAMTQSRKPVRRVVLPPPLLPPAPSPAPQDLSRRPLHALSTPAPLTPQVPDSHLKPLFATRSARTTSEVDSALTQTLLASVRDPNEDNPEHHALVRGFAPSPEKPGRGRRSYTSNKTTFAERADESIKQANAAFMLWREEAKRGMSTPPAMTVTVLSICARTEHNGAAAVPRSVLTRCLVREGEPDRAILFSVSSEPIRGSAPADVQDGRRVMIWPPWTELDVPPVLPSDGDPASTSAISGSSPVLLCSRFMVARS